MRGNDKVAPVAALPVTQSNERVRPFPDIRLALGPIDHTAISSRALLPPVCLPGMLVVFEVSFGYILQHSDPLDGEREFCRTP